MNRSQLINILAQKTGLNKKDVKRTIDEMQKLIIQEVNLVFNPAAQHET